MFKTSMIMNPQNEKKFNLVVYSLHDTHDLLIVGEECGWELDENGRDTYRLVIDPVKRFDSSFVQMSQEFDDWISFKTECSCFSHDIKVLFQKDEQDDDVSLTFYDNVYFGDNSSEGNWFVEKFRDISYRIKSALKILFKGYLEVEHAFYFKNDEHVKQFMDYMNYSYSKFFKKEDKENGKK